MSDPLKVLCLADSASAAEPLAAFLNEQLAVTFTTVSSRSDYIVAMANNDFDLILATSASPQFNNLAALQLTRESAANTPFIVVADDVGEEQAIEFIKHGATDFVLRQNMHRLPSSIERARREKEADRRRREVEELNRRQLAALDASVEGIGILDEELCFVYVNRALHTMFGYADATVGAPLKSLLPEEAHFRLRDEIVPAVCENSRWRGEMTGMRKDGTTLPMELSLAVIENTGYVCSIQDITDRIRNARALQEQSEQLHYLQKMEAMGRVAGGVAHDFNNMISVIRGFTEMMLADINNTEKTKKMLEKVAEAGRQASELTRQLLTFSRQKLDKVQQVDVNAIARRTREMMEAVAGDDVKLRAITDSREAVIEADPAQIEQVVMNLALNACDAMPDGGNLTIETMLVDFDSDYNAGNELIPAGNYVLLAVSDNGYGMPRDIQNQVFEPFFTTKGKNGTGLGLSTVYAVIKQIGGQIALYSEPGHGTTFKLYLPQVEQETQKEGQDADMAPVADTRGHETILVVEDDDKLRDFITATLRGAGYHILHADHGGEALRISHRYEGTIHALVIDVVMPGGGGPELAQAIVEDRADAKTLYISGYTRKVLLDRGLTDQHAFLQKPFSPDQLLREIRAQLDE